MTVKTPLVLVPGLACDATLWAAQRAGLADVADVSIADTLNDDSITLMAARLLASAPERFAIAGLSMGGYVTMEVWRQAPERVSHLALIDTSARADTEGDTRLREAAIASARTNGYAEMLRNGLRHFVARDCPEPIFQSVLQMAQRVGLGTYMAQQQAIMDRIDSRETLTTVTVPALVVVGDEDRVTPPERAREMAGAIPGCAYVEIADCGHMATMERPEAVNAALREWLAR
ncbi:alpha/beta fold hydrolase [Novosphingobium sp. 9]|uniref:alpha/beta fold hydrolase n=1 Tax=Novosphingobium sp. 9 TaxID=2025349 RepID=UPI0021B52C03|nr:alpha/beta hydrolase [Novosphingobium sp. 9]